MRFRAELLEEVSRSDEVEELLLSEQIGSQASWSHHLEPPSCQRDRPRQTSRPPASMGGTACCYDNASMESFFHTLKVELVRTRHWLTHEEARRDLSSYLEVYYSQQRLHSAIGCLTSEAAEQNAVQTRVRQNGERSQQSVMTPHQDAALAAVVASELFRRW